MILYKGKKGDWDFRISDLVENPDGTDIYPVVNFREARTTQLAKCTPHLYLGTPGIFSDLLRSVQMLKREWGAETNGKLPHLFIPRKTAALVPEIAVENLPLDRTAILVPEFEVEDLPLGGTL